MAPVDERYPVATDCYTPTGEDRSLWAQRLTEQSTELFQTSGGGVEVLWPRQDSSSALDTPGNSAHGMNNIGSDILVKKRFITSEEVQKYGIQQDLDAHICKHLVFVVRPVFSWSNLSITEPAFRTILTDLRTFTPFLRVVQSFGKKVNDKQRAGDLAYLRVGPSSAYEFCYNIRYFELNGRGRGNPWSLRQTGVYQNCHTDERSHWLLLSYSTYIVDRTSAALGKRINSTYNGCKVTSLLPHLFILSAVTRNWGQYIECIRQKIIVFEEKAYSSRIDETYPDDYELLFADVQKTMALGETLTTASTVIRGQRDTLSRCNDLHTILHKKNPGRYHCNTANALRMMKVDLQIHAEAVTDLAQTTSKTTQLLSAILATRANDALRGTIATMQKGVADIQVRSGKTCRDMTSLLQTTNQGHKDAITMKTLAQIATMFLPASLVASLFSSTIFSNSDSKISYLGLYFAITIPILLATLLLLLLLEKGLFTTMPRLRFPNTLFNDRCSC